MSLHVSCVTSGCCVDVGSSDVWLLSAYTGVPIWATGLQEGCGQPGENHTLQICFKRGLLRWRSHEKGWVL